MAELGTGNEAPVGDEAIILALARGASASEAATAGGCSERTVHRRMESPEFRAQVQKARARMVELALGKLADGMSAASDCLRALLGAGSESTRLGAARSILEFGSKLREAIEIEARLEAIEDRMSGDQRSDL